MKTAQKHLDFLRELNEILKITDSLSMNKLMQKHDVYKASAQILKKNGIISTNGKKSVYCRYKWTSRVKPNIKMAEKLLEECRKHNSNLQRNRKQKIASESRENAILDNQVVLQEIREKEQDLKIPTQIIEKKGKKFSLFWGVIAVEF
tara:strand:+ start:654 stop:1097 length:444 start_codon:yes stop_codon:yes gene_type:complete